MLVNDDLASMLNWLIERVDTLTPNTLKSALKRSIPGIDRKVYGALQQVTRDANVEIRVRRGAIKGRRFVCSLKFERDYWLGIWERDIETILKTQLKNGDVFYDIGVHKGYFSLIAASLIGPLGRVIGFEPNPANRKSAEHNFSLNSDLAARISLERYAILDKSGSASFTGGPDSTMGHVVRDAQTVNNYFVDTISIDEFVAIGNPAPTLVKMDIEGGERWALVGMMETLSKHKPILLVEVHDAESYDTLIHVAATAGFRLTNLRQEPLQGECGFCERSHYIAWPELD